MHVLGIVEDLHCSRKTHSHGLSRACTMLQLQCTVLLTEFLVPEAEIVLNEPEISHDGIRTWIAKVIDQQYQNRLTSIKGIT